MDEAGCHVCRWLRIRLALVGLLVACHQALSYPAPRNASASRLYKINA